MNIMVLAGSQKMEEGQVPAGTQLKNLKIVDSKNTISTNFYSGEIGEFSQVKFVRLNQKTSGFVTSSDQGVVSVLPLDIRDREIE